MLYRTESMHYRIESEDNNSNMSDHESDECDLRHLNRSNNSNDQDEADEPDNHYNCSSSSTSSNGPEVLTEDDHTNNNQSHSAAHGRLEESSSQISDRLVSAEEPLDKTNTLDAELVGKQSSSILEKDPGGEDENDPPDKEKNSSASSPVSAVDDSDDGGADHAVEDEPPNIPWKPQNVQSTCEFTHTITDYAQKRETGCKKAEYSATTVDEYGNRWRLIIYVNGNGRASNHHLSLFLQVADADDLPFGWKKAVSYVLTLEHPSGGNLSYAKRNPDKTFKLCPKAIDWGWSQFITSDRIQQEGFVANDSLTVRASVTVKSSSVSIDEEDAELYLKYAVEEGDAEAVKLCLEQGASVNCKFKDDLYTPLHTACSSGAAGNTNNETNNANGAGGNAKVEKLSGKGSSIEVLNLLLSEGADPNACNKWRETPLLIAANNGHYAACEALLEHGADPSLCSEAGWSALTFAAHKGFDDIVKLLLKKGAPVNTRVAEDNSTPLHKACAGSKPGHLAAVRLLLVCQADVHALNKWRETPLLTAANHGQAGAVELLLAAGADPCKCTDTGWSPLSIAAYKGHDDVVRLLLEEGAPTEEEDPTLSALLQAATKGLPDTVELLLRNGADHTVTTKKGDTALSILVEQNLIDAAVDMVTNYSASIPRCSRDRKKVQRARLLINLRMKQMEREKNGVGSTDEDETDDDDDLGLHTAQHQETDDLASDSTDKSKSKKKKKSKGGNSANMSAEEKARAAEEALLLELEQEDIKAKKEEAEANSKRAKKKKKKERERQQKQKEEEERKAKEEAERKERERLQREKEDKLRQEQEAKLKEQREREMKEMMEREKALAAKRKERERKEKEHGKQREKSSSQPASPSGSEASEKLVKSPKPSKTASIVSNSRSPAVINGQSKKNAALNAKQVAPLGGNRRWETKHQKSPIRPSAAPQQAPQSLAQAPRSEPPPQMPRTASVGSTKETAPPKSSAQPSRGAGVNGSSSPQVPTLSEIAMARAPVSDAAIASNPEPAPARRGIEHPAITLFRREKVEEMVQRCSLALNCGETMVRRVISRWIIRAAHDKTPYIDPMIPSWKNAETLITFFQRQFITESRRPGGGASNAVNLEVLKEAGASAATICQTIAKEIEDLRSRIEAHLPADWSDSALGMTTSETVRSGVRYISVSWANRSAVDIPAATLTALGERYFGEANRFLTTVFVAKLWYETKDQLLANTGMDLSLPTSTQARLASEASVSAELWSGPYSTYSTNVFWGIFEEVDGFFGGQPPFGKDDFGGENVLASHGCSVSVLPPLDNIVASRYVQRMLDVLSAAAVTGKPVSFALFLHAECFHDLPSGPSPDDLHLMDPRLAKANREFVQLMEVLPAGQHFYKCENSPSGSKVCTTASLFVLLQNEAAKSCFNVGRGAVARVIGSMSTGLPRQNETPIVNPIPFPVEFPLEQAPLAPQPTYFDNMRSSDPQRVISSEFGAIGGSALPIPFSPANEPITRGARPGRLFDLVDNGEDDQMNDDDLVSGMLNNLDVGLFQNGNLGSDVDIEAISLMGIGGPPQLHSSRHGSAHTGMGRFG